MNLKIEKPIRLIELFAGIGSQAKALERLGANFEHYRICEFDKYAVKSYNAIHGTDFATSDITKITAEDLGIVDTEDYCYIVTYSFPCQDLSLAGKGKGMAKGDGTRSGLLWEVERLLNECSELPQILLMENVTQVHGTKNKEHFEEWISFLESKGYSNYWQDLNAKNFGIPQNRNRCFMVSVLGDYTYEFPKEFPLDIRLKDLLEDSVDEKYYLSDTAIQGRLQSSFRQYNLERSLINDKEIHPTILARFEGSPTLLKESTVIAGVGEKKSNGGTQWYQQDRVCEGDVAISVTTAFSPYYAVQKDEIIDPFVVASRGRNPENPSDRRAGIPTEQRLEPNFSGCTNTLTTVQKDNYIVEPNSCLIQPKDRNYKAKNQPRETHIEIKNDGLSHSLRTNAETLVAEPQIQVVGNYSPSGHDASRIVDRNGLAPTVKENHGTVTAFVEPCNEISSNFRIRKLTPKECWRLMGFDDTDFEKAEGVNSNTQLYKQAGNSIVVDVLYYIFREML